MILDNLPKTYLKDIDDIYEEFKEALDHCNKFEDNNFTGWRTLAMKRGLETSFYVKIGMISGLAWFLGEESYSKSPMEVGRSVFIWYWDNRK